MVANVAILVLLLACTALLVQLLRVRKNCAELTADIQHARELSEKQQHTLDQRAELDKLKDEFISTVSHELRTPLTSIRGALGLLSAGMLGEMDPKVHNLLRIASNNTDRLVRLINDILDLQRMDSGRAPLETRRCSMPELEVQAVETMTPMAQAAGVVLQITDDTTRGEAVFDGDPDRILQVLCNLLSNAIKFSPAGASVRLASVAEGDQLVLRVIDAGRGIPADKLESIFDRFGQVDPTDSRQKGGTGLGLAICRSIAAQHGGDIWAEGHRDGAPGSTFTLRLPRLRGDSGIRPVVAQSSGAVLVCDDDPGVRHVVAEHLRLIGYTVLEADSGERAIELAANQKVDAILLDLYMPGLSGWETLERLKANAATEDIPVVVLSVLGPAFGSGTRDAAANAAQGWVQKPFDTRLLLAELGRVLYPNGGSGRILLIEDDADLATVVISGLEHHAAGNADSPRFTVEHASTLLEARQRCLREPPPDLLVLDLTLPDGSGFSFVHWLRQQPHLHSLPLVVYSGREVTANEREQLRLGPTQFLAKTRIQPHDVDDLVFAMIRNLRPPAGDAGQLPADTKFTPSHLGSQP